MHGGLFSRDDVKLDEIRKIDRFRQPSDEGTVCITLSRCIAPVSKHYYYWKPERFSSAIL